MTRIVINGVAQDFPDEFEGTDFEPAPNAGAAVAPKPGVHVPFPLVSGQYTAAFIGSTSTFGTSALSTVGNIVFMPFAPMRDITINELAVQVTTAGAGVLAHLGIYTDVNGTPSALIIGTAATLDLSTTGTKNQAIADTVLSAGSVYWLAVHNNIAGATIRAFSQSNTISLPTDYMTSGVIFNARSLAQSFGPLPATVVTTGASGGPVPIVRMKIA